MPQVTSLVHPYIFGALPGADAGCEHGRQHLGGQISFK